MIRLLNRHHKNTIGYFKSYNDLADYIHKKELSRIRLSIATDSDQNLPHDWEQEPWGFSVYTHEFSKTIYSTMREPLLTGIELEAFQRELDVIEIYYGDANNPTQIPVTEDIDIGSLRKDWRLEYCKEHDYAILETPDFLDCEDTMNNRETTGGKDDLAL